VGRAHNLFALLYGVKAGIGATHPKQRRKCAILHKLGGTEPGGMAKAAACKGNLLHDEGRRV
jgi:hypothetical protein